MLKNSPLGQQTVYVETYAPELLYPVPRSLARDKTGIAHPLPFSGIDIWNAYELSWLNSKGKPQIAMAEIIFPCTSEYLVESKSLKLYLNSFNQTNFASIDDVGLTIKKDLQACVQTTVEVEIFAPMDVKEKQLVCFHGISLDALDITMDAYVIDPSFLITGKNTVEEKVYTDLFKSNCLATGQPDWGSIFIHYSGKKIDHEGLLKYLLSFRRHSGFAEHCVEHIFQELMASCKPERLSVYGRFTRRGGLDINPFRSNFDQSPLNLRHYRQ